MKRNKVATLALGVVGLATALSLAAFAAPARAASKRPTYRPAGDAHVVTTVPRRDATELAARRALAEAPDRIELAIELATADIRRYRQASDPRYLGHAQATLAPWWKLASPPPEVLLVRATILQSIHEFPAARADLDRLVALHPDDAQANLTRAVVATVTGDYAAARESCAAVARRAGPLVAATCVAPLDGLAGAADQAYARLANALAVSRASADVRGWALTTLAELAFQRGDSSAAETHARAALALDDSDAYARALLADILLDTGRPGEIAALVAHRETIDSLVLRRAIAEHQLHGPDAARLTQTIRDRIAAAAERGDRIHLREEARFVLEVEQDPRRAARIARENWTVQKELADARLLARAAAAAGDRELATPVIAWAVATGVQDVQLARALATLGAP